MVGHLISSTVSALPSIIPGEGWTIWLNCCKLAMLFQENFHSHTQYLYSQKYWEQPNKLGSLYCTINWKIFGIAWKKISLAQHLWSTKWMTNWLLVRKICYDGTCGPLIGAQAARLRLKICFTFWLVQPDTDHCKYLSMKIAKLKQHLVLKKLPPLVVTTFHT